MATRNVDDVAAELYAVKPSAFVAARTAARSARDAGDRELAAVIGKLRRPAIAAWAVNLLTRDRGNGLTQLLMLGEELREAAQQLQGEALQLLSSQRHGLLAALTQRARKLAEDAGHSLGAQTAAQVEQTLGAALADPDVARDVQGGQLVAPLGYAGFGPAVAASLPSSRPEQDLPAPHPVPRANELAQLRQRQRLERDLAEATKRRDAAARRVRDAEQAWADAERTVQRLTE